MKFKHLLCGIILLNSQTAISENLPISDLERFTTVIEHIKNYHVAEVEDKVLLENAIRGMLTNLDPHSAYLDKEEFNDLKVSTSGKFGGLGIEVTLEDNFIRVISPIDGTPAEKAGIKSADLIIRIDDKPVKGLSLREAVDLMRGAPGSEILLSIVRQGEPKPLRIKLIRDIINVKSIRSEIMDDEYAYVRISQFQDDTGNEFAKSLNSLQKQIKKPIKGLLLDLRNNPGGLLDASVNVTNVLLDKEKLKHDGLIVYTKGRFNSQIKEKATSNDMLKKAPVVVLVNGGSASASEIVAGALQDHKRALILGTKTFGKGSVQTILPLKDQRGLKLTTALYYTPSGRSIQATGITPDLIIEDLDIPKPKDNELDDLLLKEADLQGHLENGNLKSKKDNAKKSKDKKQEIPLIQRDYQRYQALNILKSLAVMK